ncbi:hypothetical protein VFPBJ_09427 [Purpureocillium lilacinum]|uniref:Uncharacterized protein n=1 Tax=Purpureocillium lilacinum TaxID=33203 RepID=A0A179GCD1_PURLI|nr:hypothetical protein VFPBJ_09427 [Purpureocillium lilacinum]
MKPLGPLNHFYGRYFFYCLCLLLSSLLATVPSLLQGQGSNRTFPQDAPLPGNMMSVEHNCQQTEGSCGDSSDGHRTVAPANASTLESISPVSGSCSTCLTRGRRSQDATIVDCLYVRECSMLTVDALTYRKPLAA